MSFIQIELYKLKLILDEKVNENYSDVSLKRENKR